MSSLSERANRLERAAGGGRICTCTPGGARLVVPAGDLLMGKSPDPGPPTVGGRCTVCGGDVVTVRFVEVDDWRSDERP